VTDEQGPPGGRPWRGQWPEQRREARRRRLLDAALELFGTVGYAGTPLTAVCAQANVSPRHFYELYPGREQLMADLYDEVVGELIRLVRAAQEAAPLTVEARIRAGLRAAVLHETADPRRARVLSLEAVGVSPWMEEHRRAVVTMFAEATEEQYRRLVAAGQLVDRPFRHVSTALIGAFDELLVDWLLSEPQPPASELVPVVEEVVLAVFRGRTVGAP
jgi:AcrR family transcriptional regulator